MKIQFIYSILLILCGSAHSVESSLADNVPLWNNDVPAALGTAEKDTPILIPYLPEPATGKDAAVIICPGGAYGGLAMESEGKTSAKWFTSIGISTFVLKYRLPAEGYPHPVPLLDVQRAIRLVRFNAAKWKIDPAKIGLVGFSAGGHLASSAGTHFEKPVKVTDTLDEVDAVSCRPDFMILVYPVISMLDEITHMGSKNNLLGNKPDSALVELMSNEKQVTAQTPPTFLVHASDDKIVAPANCVRFYLACLNANIPAEIHIYRMGGHAFSIPQTGPIATWPGLCRQWMQELGFLPKE